MRTYKLHLIRHGMTTGNLKGQYIGLTDLPITTNGINELKNLQKQGIYPKCDLIFSPSLKRAVETAEIIYPNYFKENIIINEKLTEINFGSFEGKTAEDLKDNEDYKKWLAGELKSAPMGETTLEFVTRLCTGINEIVHIMMEREAYSAAVIMSGGAIMSLLSVSAVPRKKMAEWTMENGCGYTVQITPSLYHSSGILEVIGEISDKVENFTTSNE